MGWKMDKEEYEIAKKTYDDNVLWLRNSVPRDDVYDFAYEMLLYLQFMCQFTANHLDLMEIAKDDQELQAAFIRTHEITERMEEKVQCVIESYIIPFKEP